MIENIFVTLASEVANIIGQLGYLGVMGLMAIESSFIPFPSEIIIPPAAYLASQGQFNIYLVILAGIIGSLIGALVNYYLAYSLGRKVMYSLADSKLSRFLFISSEKLKKSEKYFIKYGGVSTLIGRLVPVIRQLISIPAGFSKMNLTSFAIYTSLGSGIWVIVLAVLGYVFGENQEMFEKYYGEISLLFVALAVGLVIGIIIKKKLEVKKQKGFTLIELLVVIAIIGLLATIVLVSLNTARTKARDTKRLADMRQIILALAMYHDDNNGNYPQENSSNGGWEHSYEDSGDFIDALKDNGYMSAVPVDPVNSGSQYYSYYVYGAGGSGCDSSRGEFYVLGIRDMENSGRPHADSFGWNCPSRDWQNEFDWVTGNFEN